ncbi:hypothetical protein [Glaciibacter psychrotolerans]|uniref:Uncharacterized protein n=1 Tax=Glaciibacter psychrotolerans TaxID=670054 RepID=A0A7Z0EG98_9MICO|nr:hypothetical protein [Leifsonia psychrotolerans]NYJ21123.1 hypothetical protein [Leifsonia psychrotolerans]
MEDIREVNALTGTEGGIWRIVTQGSTHVMDLDSGTVTRHPGPGRPSTVNDRPRPLRTIDACRVGARGHWTMLSDDMLIDYYWQDTSVIRRIELLTGVALAKAYTAASFQTMKATYGLFTEAEVTEILGLKQAGPDEIQELLVSRKLLGFARDGALQFPGFQFDLDLGTTKQVIPDLVTLALELKWRLDELALWLCAPSTYFKDDACPVAFIDQPDELLKKFHAQATVEW